ncbi:hypothetical protein FRC03_005480 [Tulasnella sp. 419]|nr:hypothetical protein FRC03_005480 [Tulasnella sp. 419]
MSNSPWCSVEILFGIWRAYSSLDTAIASDGTTSLPPPRRFLFPHTKAGDWRDYAGLNQFIIHSAFPSVAMECQEDWTDRSEMGLPFLFKRVVFADRSAAINGKMYSPKERYSLSAFTLPGGDNWWAPVRHNVLEATGLDTRTTSGSSSKPVITYISRQAWGRRSLRSQDHDTLVKGLRKLELEQGVEVNIVEMEKLTRREQLRLAGRSTIIMGPHGNGLTSLVWMEPTPSATVMEFFIPGGFAADYQWTTEALGMKYYGFWGSTYFTSENPPPRAFPEGFHSSEIPLDSETVVSLCRKILTESS